MPRPKLCYDGKGAGLLAVADWRRIRPRQNQSATGGSASATMHLEPCINRVLWNHLGGDRVQGGWEYLTAHYVVVREVTPRT